MSGRRIDLVSLVAGLAIAALGAVLLLDQTEAIELTWGWLGAVNAAVLGAILVASGLDEARAARAREAEGEESRSDG